MARVSLPWYWHVSRFAGRLLLVGAVGLVLLWIARPEVSERPPDAASDGLLGVLVFGLVVVGCLTLSVTEALRGFLGRPPCP